MNEHQKKMKRTGKVKGKNKKKEMATKEIGKGKEI